MSLTLMTPDTLLVRNPELISTDMNGDTVVMDMDIDTYFGVGGVGTRIWEQLAEPIACSEIIASICNEYTVDEETCEADLYPFLQKLIDLRLVTIA